MRIAATFAIALLAAGCQKPAPPPQETGEAAVDEERNNLLNAGHGAAVVSRTAELTLRESAMRAIDGDPRTAWSTPANDKRQTLVFSLPAPVRIETLGLLTSVAARTRTSALTLEVSADGETYRKVLDVKTEATRDPQLFDAAVERAQYVRVNVLQGPGSFATLSSVLLRGEWLARPAAPPITGCWTINGLPARFVEDDGRVEGIIEQDEPLLFSGGKHEATYLLNWAEGPQWGETLITLSPDGERLSGVRWHEEPAAHSYGNDWFGVRRPCAPADVDGEPVWRRFLAAGGWYPLFEAEGPAAAIIANALRRLPSQRLRLVAREHRQANAQESRKHAEARLQSLRTALVNRGVDVSRIDFAAMGSHSPRRPVPTVAFRLMYSVVEMQIDDTARSAF